MTSEHERQREPINASLREHAVSLQDWARGALDLGARARELHRWAEIFEEEFGLGVDVPAIGLDELPRSRLGHYRYGRNAFGLADEIALNVRHADRPLSDVLATLLHEMLHQWQAKHGAPGKRNYHNREFRLEARTYGLVVDEHGHSAVVEGPFTRLLARRGVQVADSARCAAPAEAAAEPARGKNKKYRCDCTNVRCAVELRARCLRCGAEFAPAAAAWRARAR